MVFFQYFTGINLIGLKQEIPHRISSFFGDEFILGSFISKYLPFLILFFLINEKYNILFLPVLFLLLILSFVAGERTAFITTLLISFFTILKLYNIKKIIFFILITIVGFSIIINVDDVTKQRMIYSTIESTKIISEWKNPKSLKIYTSQHNAHFQSAYLMYKKGNISEKLLGEELNLLEKIVLKKNFVII